MVAMSDPTDLPGEPIQPVPKPVAGLMLGSKERVYPSETAGREICITAVMQRWADIRVSSCVVTARMNGEPDALSVDEAVFACIAEGVVMPIASAINPFTVLVTEMAHHVTE